MLVSLSASEEACCAADLSTRNCYHKRLDMISVTLNMTLNGELALPLETEKHSQVV